MVSGNAGAGDDLLRLLRCPRCMQDLVFNSDKTSLTCTSPADAVHLWPVVDGIPRFVEAAVDAGFDLRWRRHPRPQATTRGIFEQKTGWYGALGGSVLDAGCGCGRFTEVAWSKGAAEVWAVDGSPAGVEATKALVPHAEVIQADLLRLPFADGSFDRAFSIGVLHHTGDTRAAFMEIARTVRQGGEFAVWLYADPAGGNADLRAAQRFLHEVTRACPPAALHAACEKYAPKLRDIYYAGAGRDPAWAMLRAVLQISASDDDDECVSDTFDWMCPQYRDWHDYPEVEEWFDAAGFDVIRRGPFPTSVRGRKR